MECLPLVMEPESGFYADPVVVLDFQSLYPSMIIAYNLCFSTCLGKVTSSKSNTLGVSSYAADPNVVMDLRHEILFTPNGVMYVPSKVKSFYTKNFQIMSRIRHVISCFYFLISPFCASSFGVYSAL